LSKLMLLGIAPVEEPTGCGFVTITSSSAIMAWPFKTSVAGACGKSTEKKKERINWWNNVLKWMLQKMGSDQWWCNNNDCSRMKVKSQIHRPWDQTREFSEPRVVYTLWYQTTK
jgi:hypothetical protein